MLKKIILFLILSLFINLTYSNICGEADVAFYSGSITDSTIQFKTVLGRDRYLITRFDRKEWGTWNIGGWYIEDNNTKTLLAGGGTDWEYVFRVASNSNGGAAFSGGNHGNEKLISLKTYNGDTNEELDFANIKDTKMIKIVEITELLFHNSQNPYARVKREYSVYPKSITLNTHFDFIEDAYFNLSYVCMFPVEKTFSKNFKYMESGNVYTTPPRGTTETKPGSVNYLGKEKTKSIKIDGGENSDVRFEVWIGNEEMVNYFDNDYKVFVWDLNQFVNKVYFSKYRYSNENVLVKKDTMWDNEAGWSININ